MSKVTVFLRTALFSLGGDEPHVPTGTMVLRGSIVGERTSGTLTLNVVECLDGRGRTLPCGPVTLLLPMSKVDHVLLLDE